MPFTDHALAQRLEHTEGYACAQFAAARKRSSPESTSTWTEYAGAILTFDGIEAPTTQSFGLGIVAELTRSVLAEAEEFFFSRGSAALHEICPLVGPQALALLCEKAYRPIEVSNVLFRSIDRPGPVGEGNVLVRVIAPEDWAVWTEVSTRGWTHEHPELEDFVRTMGN